MSEFVAPKEDESNRGIRLAAVILFFIAGVAACFEPTLLVALKIISNPTNYGWAGIEPIAIVALTSTLLYPIAGIAFALLGMLSKNKKLNFWLALGFFGFVGPIFWIVQTLFILMSRWQQIYLTPAFEAKGVLPGLALFALAIGTFFSGLLAWSSPKTQSTTSHQYPMKEVIPSGQNIDTAPLSNLPVFALVAAFIVPIAAVILGHISLGQINRGQISNQNRGLAVAGLVLGYVFMALSIIATVLFAIIFALSQHPSYY